MCRVRYLIAVESLLTQSRIIAVRFLGTSGSYAQFLTPDRALFCLRAQFVAKDKSISVSRARCARPPQVVLIQQKSRQSQLHSTVSPIEAFIPGPGCLVPGFWRVGEMPYSRPHACSPGIKHGHVVGLIIPTQTRSSCMIPGDSVKSALIRRTAALRKCLQILHCFGGNALPNLVPREKVVE